MERDFVEKILAAAVQAPSADNLQPWRFRVREDSISLYLTAERSADYLGSAMAFLACGAAIENMTLTARAEGYEALVRLFPDAQDNNHIADVSYTKVSAPTSEPLAEHIPKRVTNRRYYKERKLETEAMRALEESARISGEEIQVQFIEDKSALKVVAEGLATGIRMQLENEEIHRFFYKHLRFTPEDIASTKDGIPLKAMSLNALTTFELKLMRSWRMAKIASLFGASHMGADSYAERYLASSAFAALYLSGNSDRDFVVGGRAIQRLWLKATELGLAVQPIAGLFIGQGADGEKLTDLEMLSEKQYHIVEKDYREIRSVLDMENKVLAIVLRLGYARPPAARSLRKEPIIITK